MDLTWCTSLVVNRSLQNWSCQLKIEENWLSTNRDEFAARNDIKDSKQMALCWGQL